MGDIALCLLEWIEQHPGTAAWAQAFGAILAVVVAILVSARDRKNTRQFEYKREKLALQRIVTALRVEVEEAIDASERQETIIRTTMADNEMAGVPIADTSLAPEAFTLTDGTIYRAAAMELGLLPEQLVRQVVNFYSMAKGMEQLGHIGPAFVTMQTLLPLHPRLRMIGNLLSKSLEKFSRSDFDPRADLSPSEEEITAAAKRHGYPLDEVKEAYGIRA